MSTQPDWVEDANAWNIVTLGSATIPGICVVAVEKSRDVDTKKSPGNDGAVSTDKGSNPAKVTITVSVLRKNWKTWQLVLPQIEPNRPGAFASPLEIRNAEANSRGVKAVRVLKIASESPTARSAKVYRIDCEEWFPSTKKSKSKPKADTTTNYMKANIAEQPTRYTSFLFGANNQLALQGATPDDAANVMANSFQGDEGLSVE